MLEGTPLCLTIIYQNEKCLVKKSSQLSLFPVSHYSVQPALDWAVPQSSRLKYRQLFNSHDKMMSGHLTGTQTHTDMPLFLFIISVMFATALAAFDDFLYH